MVQCLPAISSHLLKILEYSGKSFGHIGNYNQCLDTPNMRYNQIILGIGSDLGTQIGLCLPKICTKNQIQLTLNSLLKSAKLPLTVIEVNNDIPNYHYDFDWVFFLTFIIFITTLVLFVLSTLTKQNKGISMFSLQQSSKIFKRNPASNLNVLNGVRSLSMIWVVFGHSMFYTLTGAINISTSAQTLGLETPIFLMVQGGLFAVDIFFFVAGILLAYVFLRTQNIKWIAYPMTVIQRVLRFWPSYLFAMMVYYSVYLHLGTGPFWGFDQQSVKMCSKIWKPLLFVDNLVDNGETQCMGWGWYIQNDMQLFVFSLAILFVYSLKPIASKVLIFLLMIGSMTYTYKWTFDHGTHVITHLTDFATLGEYMTSVYMKPWARASPYLWGLFIGILYSEHSSKSKKTQVSNQAEVTQSWTLFGFIESKVKSRKAIRIVMEWIGIAIMIFCITIVRSLQVGTVWPQQYHAAYHAFGKVLFVIGLSFTILPSILGCQDSVIRFTMDTNFFNFIAKISFCTYLIHLTILEVWINSRTNSRYFTPTPIVVEFGGVLVLSMAAGTVMTFLIEIPFSKIQKLGIDKLKNYMTGNKKETLLQSAQRSEITEQKIISSESNEEKLTQTGSSIRINKTILVQKSSISQKDIMAQNNLLKQNSFQESK